MPVQKPERRVYGFVAIVWKMNLSCALHRKILPMHLVKLRWPHYLPYHTPFSSARSREKLTQSLVLSSFGRLYCSLGLPNSTLIRRILPVSPRTSGDSSSGSRACCELPKFIFQPPKRDSAFFFIVPENSAQNVKSCPVAEVLAAWGKTEALRVALPADSEFKHWFDSPMPKNHKYLTVKELRLIHITIDTPMDT